MIPPDTAALGIRRCLLQYIYRSNYTVPTFIFMFLRGERLDSWLNISKRPPFLRPTQVTAGATFNFRSPFFLARDPGEIMHERFFMAAVENKLRQLKISFASFPCNF